MKKCKDMEEIGRFGRHIGGETAKLYMEPLKGKVKRGSLADDIDLGRRMANDFKKNAKGQV